MNRKKILIVDDNRVVLKALSVKFNTDGYDVLLAEDGAGAVSMARRERPDLILLDILFPPDVAHGGGVPWDGFLIMNWLRRLDETKDIPVIVITGGDPGIYKERALAAGALSFFPKMMNSENLLNLIRQALASRKERPTANVPHRKRVLFVDDEGDWRFMAGTCLQDAGFEVITAADAAEALRRMELVKLDAIVLDLNLAGENGLLLMEFLKQKHPGVPILIYTGMAHDTSAIQGMIKQGARKYLRKGSMAELCDTIKSMVN
jgi:CheY-like chemotaxis protein